MTIQTFAKQLTRTTKYKLNNGTYIPVAGFGTYDIPEAETYDLVTTALQVGYRHIDSAVVYKNELAAAKAIADFLKSNPDVARKDIWFTTKIWNGDQGYEQTKLAVQHIADDVKKYIGYVDLILLHLPKTNKEKRLGSWKALQEYVLDPNNDTLQIHSIGVSNFGIAHVEELLKWDGLHVRPSINQLELHPWLPQLKLREYLTAQDILIEAYSPLTQGKKLSDPELLELEQKYRVPKAEILLKWSYLQGFIVLAKSSNKQRIKENFDVLPAGNASLDDPLHEGSNLGKIDLDPNILERLDKPDSHEVLTWGNKDPTQYVDGEE